MNGSTPGKSRDSETAASTDPRADVLAELRDGPKSSRELGCDTGFLRAMEEDGLVKIDPDPWPDEYVPGNPLIARLPGDESAWPGWLRDGWRL